MALDLTDFTTASRPRRTVCTVARVLAALDPKDRDVVTAALANEDITHSAIANVLQSAGHDLKQGTVSRHRRGGCSCGA
jgi:hypothetical protein